MDVDPKKVQETFYLISAGKLSFSKGFASYLGARSMENVIGGVALVTADAYAEFFEPEAKLK